MCAQLGEEACLLRDELQSHLTEEVSSPCPPLLLRTSFYFQAGILVGSPSLEVAESDTTEQLTLLYDNTSRMASQAKTSTVSQGPLSEGRACATGV